jgi:cytochrome d ubiquinol oxidase subunit I
MAALPLSYLAMETGWVTREVGRQPWVVHGLLRTGESASRIPAGTVAVSLIAFALVYVFLATMFFFFASRIISRGPALSPGENGSGYNHPGKGRDHGVA